MGCCQTPPNHQTPHSTVAEPFPREVATNRFHEEEINHHSKSEIEVPQEILQALNQKQKYVLMIIDKLDIDVQLLIDKGNTKEASFFFTRKLLFEKFLKKIEEYLGALEHRTTIGREDIEIMSAFLDDISTCSMINYTSIEFQKLSTEHQSSVFHDFADFFDRYLPMKTSEVEALFRNYSANFLKNKQFSPLFQKNIGKHS